MSTNIKQIIHDHFTTAARANMESGLKNVYSTIERDALLASYSAIPQTIANNEARLVTNYIMQLNADMKAMLGETLDACGITRNREQVIWMNVMSQASVPKPALCHAKDMPDMKPEKATPQSDNADIEKRRQDMQKLFQGACIATAAGAVIIFGANCLIVPIAGFSTVANAVGVTLSIAGIAGMLYSKNEEKKLDLISTQAAVHTVQQDPVVIKKIVSGICDAQLRNNSALLSKWIDQVADALCVKCETLLANS